MKTHQITSVQAAAKSYDIPRTTLTQRYRGRVEQRDAQQFNRKLTVTEESVLVRWILSMDERESPLRLATVQQMANHLLKERDNSDSSVVQTIGEC